MTAGVLTNIDELNEALAIYQKVVKVEASEAVRNKMADIAFRASQNTDFTPRDSIRSQLSNLPITKDGGKKRSGNTKYVGLYKLINWQRKLNGLLPAGGSKYRMKNITKPGSMVYQERRVKNQIRGSGPSQRINPFMDGKYKAFLKVRSSSSKFIRVAWGVAADFYGKPFSRGDFGSSALARFSGQAYGGASIKQVNADMAEFSMFNGAGSFDLRGKEPKLRSAKDQTNARKIIEAGLKKAVDFVLYDSKNGIVPYLQARAKRVEQALKVMGRLK
jgi:hypothetical protein